jgi:hypothetical protein
VLVSRVTVFRRAEKTHPRWAPSVMILLDHWDWAGTDRAYLPPCRSWWAGDVSVGSMASDRPNLPHRPDLPRQNLFDRAALGKSERKQHQPITSPRSCTRRTASSGRFLGYSSSNVELRPQFLPLGQAQWLTCIRVTTFADLKRATPTQLRRCLPTICACARAAGRGCHCGTSSGSRALSQATPDSGQV